MDNTKQDILALISYHIELQTSIDEMLNFDLTKFGLDISDVYNSGTDAEKLFKLIQHNVNQSLTSLMKFYSENKFNQEED